MPAPLGPNRHTVSPAATVRSKPSQHRTVRAVGEGDRLQPQPLAGPAAPAAERAGSAHRLGAVEHLAAAGSRWRSPWPAPRSSRTRLRTGDWRSPRYISTTSSSPTVSCPAAPGGRRPPGPMPVPICEHDVGHRRPARLGRQRAAPARRRVARWARRTSPTARSSRPKACTARTLRSRSVAVCRQPARRVPGRELGRPDAAPLPGGQPDERRAAPAGRARASAGATTSRTPSAPASSSTFGSR